MCAPRLCFSVILVYSLSWHSAYSSPDEGPCRANITSWCSDGFSPEHSKTLLLHHHCSVAEGIDFEVGGYVKWPKNSYHAPDISKIVAGHRHFSRHWTPALTDFFRLVWNIFFKRPSLKWWKMGRWKFREPVSENMYFSNCSLGICFSKYCILLDGRSDSWESWKTFRHFTFFLYMRVYVIYIYIYSHSPLPILLISYLQQDQDRAKFLRLVFRRNSLLWEFSPSLP